jgi:hypothetical protein
MRCKDGNLKGFGDDKEVVDIFKELSWYPPRGAIKPRTLSQRAADSPANMRTLYLRVQIGKGTA